MRAQNTHSQDLVKKQVKLRQADAIYLIGRWFIIAVLTSLWYNFIEIQQEKPKPHAEWLLMLCNHEIQKTRVTNCSGIQKHQKWLIACIITEHNSKANTSHQGNTSDASVASQELRASSTARPSRTFLKTDTKENCSRKKAQHKHTQKGAFQPSTSSLMGQAGVQGARQWQSERGGMEGCLSVCLSAQRAPESPCTTYSHPGKLGTPNWEATESLTRQKFVSSKTGFLDPSTQALGTSLLKASHWSSWESNFWHYRLEKIFPLLTPSLHSHNLSVRLKTTALLHSEQKMQLQS